MTWHSMHGAQQDKQHTKIRPQSATESPTCSAHIRRPAPTHAGLQGTGCSGYRQRQRIGPRCTQCSWKWHCLNQVGTRFQPGTCTSGTPVPHLWRSGQPGTRYSFVWDAWPLLRSTRARLRTRNLGSALRLRRARASPYCTFCTELVAHRRWRRLEQIVLWCNDYTPLRLTTIQILVSTSTQHARQF